MGGAAAEVGEDGGDGVGRARQTWVGARPDPHHRQHDEHRAEDDDARQRADAEGDVDLARPERHPGQRHDEHLGQDRHRRDEPDEEMPPGDRHQERRDRVERPPDKDARFRAGSALRECSERLDDARLWIAT